MLRRKSFSGLIALTFLLSACGGSDADTASTPAPDTTAPGAPAPEVLKDFIWIAPAVVTSADPSSPGPLPNLLAVEIGSRAVSYDPTELPGGGCDQLVSITELRGELAESWEYLADGTTIRMTFRQGVLSAVGNEMTTADVKWSFDRLIETSGSGKFFTSRIARWQSINHPSGLYTSSPFDIVDDYTMDIRTHEVGALDVAVLTQGKWIVFDTKHLIDGGHITPEDPWAAKYLEFNSVTFGPWFFYQESFRPGEEVVLNRNPNYYAPEEFGNIGRVIMRAVPDGSVRTQLVIAGDVDFAAQLVPTDYGLVASSGGQTLDCASGDRHAIALQQDAGALFADVRLRQAVSFAIDRQEATTAAYSGFGGVPSTEGMGTALQPQSTKQVTFDPARAKELMAEAGYPDGFSMTLTYSDARPSPASGLMAFNVQQQLSRVGIDVELVAITDAAEYQETFMGGRFEAMINFLDPAVPDAAYSAGLFSACDSHLNGHKHCNPEYDRLQQVLAGTAPGDPARDVALGELSDLIVEIVDMVYVTDMTLPRAFSGRVVLDEYQHHPFMNTLKIHHLSLN